MVMALDKNPLMEKGFYKLYHIASEKNLNGILTKGLYARNIMKKEQFKFEDISDQDIQKRREERHLHDYASLYFNPRNAMLFKLEIIKRNIVIVEFSTKFADKKPASEILISNKNASTNGVKIVDLYEARDLLISKKQIFSKSWYDPNIGCARKDLKQLMQSECLVKNFLSSRWITRIIVKDRSQKSRIQYFCNDVEKIHVDVDKEFFFHPNTR